jgi:thiamine biosynthesis lipoprotein
MHIFRSRGNRFSAFLIAVCLLGATLATSCARRTPERRFETIFQSACSVSIYDRPSDETFEAVWARLREIDAMMNMWNEDSDLSRLNAAAGTGAVAVPAEILEVLGHALRLCDLSGGRYDPTVGPLVKLWGVGTPRARVPEAAAIAEALSLLDRASVRADVAAGTVELGRPGMALDFGSVAKGFGVVQTGRILAQRGVKSAIADLGGCVLALGSNPSGGSWRIGIQDPSAERGRSTVGYFLARDAAVATSGTYERRFVQDGKSYHHIMDTSTGYPVDNSIVSVTVLVERDSNPDGPPLALLALGAERGLELADELGIAAVFIEQGRRLRVSKKAKAIFVKTSSDYIVTASPLASCPDEPRS